MEVRFGQRVLSLWCLSIVSTKTSRDILFLYDIVWIKAILLKVSLFASRLLQNRLPTKDNLIHHECIQANSCFCVNGCGKEENTNHLFMGYDLFGFIWPLIRQWFIICSTDSMYILDHFQYFVHLGCDSRKSLFLLHLIWLAMNLTYDEMASYIFNVSNSISLRFLIWLIITFTLFMLLASVSTDLSLFTFEINTLKMDKIMHAQ